MQKNALQLHQIFSKYFFIYYPFVDKETKIVELFKFLDC